MFCFCRSDNEETPPSRKWFKGEYFGNQHFSTWQMVNIQTGLHIHEVGSGALLFVVNILQSFRGMDTLSGKQFFQNFFFCLF